MYKHNEYPYSAWALSPSYKPYEVAIARHYDSTMFDTEISDKLRNFRPSELYESKDDAIYEGWKMITRDRAKITKMASRLDKREWNLTNATHGVL